MAKAIGLQIAALRSPPMASTGLKNFMKLYLSIQKLLGENTQTDI
jgi:hypothetical protein